MILTGKLRVKSFFERLFPLWAPGADPCEDESDGNVDAECEKAGILVR